MNCDQARQIFRIEDIAQRIGAVEQKATADRREIWCLSPWRNEKTASFKIDTQRQTWYDHGDPETEGGDLIKLVQCHLQKEGKQATISAALQWLRPLAGRGVAGPSKQRTTAHPERKQPANDSGDSPFKLAGEKVIKNPVLVAYINDRGLPPDLVRLYAKEITAKHKTTGTKVFGIGLPNDLGGYELRGAVGDLKVPVENKAMSTLYGRGEIDTLNIVEGQFDFYTMALLWGERDNEAVAVLNGAKLWRQAVQKLQTDPRLQQVRNVKAWTQHDNTGRQLLLKLGDELQGKYSLQDMSAHYRAIKNVEIGQEGKKIKIFPELELGEEKLFEGLNEWWQEYKKWYSWPSWAQVRPERPSYSKTTFKPAGIPKFGRL